MIFRERKNSGPRNVACAADARRDAKIRWHERLRRFVQLS